MFVLLAHKASEAEADQAIERLQAAFPGQEFCKQPQPGSTYRFDVGCEGPVNTTDLGAMQPVAKEK